MAEVDALYLTPKERAEGVWAIIQLGSQEFKTNVSMFDITCFATQWLAQLSLGQLSNDAEFRQVAITANRWLHKYHYLGAEEIHDSPDRLKRKE